jgi:hypothetical protein
MSDSRRARAHRHTCVTVVLSARLISANREAFAVLQITHPACYFTTSQYFIALLSLWCLDVCLLFFGVTTGVLGLSSGL